VSLASDLRLAARSLARHPAWTLAVAATLAIGLAGATVVGGIGYGVLLRPLPYPDPGRIVRVYEVDGRGRRMNFADPNFADLGDLGGAFEAIAKAPSWSYPALVGREPLEVHVARVTAGFFDVLGVGSVRGRGFAAGEQVEGAARVALVSERFWRSRLGAPADLEGVELRVAGRPVRVVGVLPAGFDFPSGTELWVPREPDGALASRTAHNEPVYARLARGTTIEQARRRASELGARLARDHAGRIDLADLALVPLLDSLVVGARPAVLIELAAGAFLLLAAVVNAASLMLARLETRRRDLATRLALGAGGRQIGSLLFAEAILLVALAAAAGTALAAAAIGLVRRHAPAALPRFDAVELGGVVAAGAAAIALLVATILALAAARRALRWNVERELRESSGTLSGSGRPWLRGLPVAVQAGAAVVLLAGAALIASSLLRLTSVAPGFEPRGVTALDLAPTHPEEESEIGRRAARLAAFEDEIAALPGVRAAGLVNALPIASGAANGTFFELAGPELPEPFDFEAVVRSAPSSGDALFLVASAGYFRAMGIPLLEGRLFEPGDTRDRQHVALVSKTLAEATWPGRSALGRYLEFGNMDGDLRPLLVVGVVGDVHQRGLAEGPQPAIYVDALQRPASAWSWSLVTAGGALGGETLTRAARRSFPEAPTAVRDLEAIVAGSVSDRGLVLAVLAAFALATIALAAAGIFGAVSFAVAMRRREFAVRLALGAEGGRVARRAFAGGLVPVAAGAAVGLVTAVAGGRLLQALLFGVRPQHPPALGAALAVVALFAAVAAWLPARRAGRIEPAAVLRAE